jgi:hypothetical protein
MTTPASIDITIRPVADPPLSDEDRATLGRLGGLATDAALARDPSLDRRSYATAFVEALIVASDAMAATRAASFAKGVAAASDPSTLLLAAIREMERPVVKEVQRDEKGAITGIVEKRP